MPDATESDEVAAPYSEFYGALGKRLRAIRETRGWSFADVERRSDGQFARPILTSWERGIRRPPVEPLLRLAALYEVGVEDLLTATPGRTPVYAEDVIDLIRRYARMGEEDAAPPAIPAPRERDESEDVPEVRGA